MCLAAAVCTASTTWLAPACTVRVVPRIQPPHKAAAVYICRTYPGVGRLQFRYVESEELVESRKVVGVCWGQVGQGQCQNLAFLTVSGMHPCGLQLGPHGHRVSSLHLLGPAVCPSLVQSVMPWRQHSSSMEAAAVLSGAGTQPHSLQA